VIFVSRGLAAVADVLLNEMYVRGAVGERGGLCRVRARAGVCVCVCVCVVER